MDGPRAPLPREYRARLIVNLVVRELEVRKAEPSATRNPAIHCRTVPDGEAQRPVFAKERVPRPFSSVSRTASQLSIPGCC